MWLPSSVLAEVDELARIVYIDLTATVRWNRNRHKDELRLLTGWAWIARSGGEYRQGFKTKTVAYRDAYYALCRRQAAPGGTGQRARRLHAVSDNQSHTKVA